MDMLPYKRKERSMERSTSRHDAECLRSRGCGLKARTMRLMVFKLLRGGVGPRGPCGSCGHEPERSRILPIDHRRRVAPEPVESLAELDAVAEIPSELAIDSSSPSLSPGCVSSQDCCASTEVGKRSPCVASRRGEIFSGGGVAARST